MIRRGTGRTPPYILVALLLIIVILGFNYWTLSSQNGDLSQELEKLQSEVKISAMKQEQSEKKNSALQETVHEMDGLSNRLRKEIQEDKEALKESSTEVQKLKYEITTLKNKVAKMQEQISSLNQQAEDCEVDLSKMKETNSHLTVERDDAVEAIADKDSTINSLKRQLEQVSVKRSQLILSLATCNSEVVQLKKECEEVQRASDDLANIIVQTKRDAQLESETQLYAVKEQLAEEMARSDMLNITIKDLNLKLTKSNRELSECQRNLKASVLSAAKLREAQDEAAAARREKIAIAKPKVVPGMMNIPDIEHKAPPVMERPAAPGEGNKPIQAPLHPIGLEGPGPQNDVLVPPPQHLQGRLENNLDAAVDEDEKVVEDMMDDQDEEGNEVKQNHDVDNIHEERTDMLKNENVGAVEVPQPFQADSFNHQDMNVDDVGNHGNYYDTNLENKIRNLGRPPDIH